MCVCVSEREGGRGGGGKAGGEKEGGETGGERDYRGSQVNTDADFNEWIEVLHGLGVGNQ